MANKFLPFGKVPYSDYACPEPTSNLSLSEESEVDEKLTSQTNNQSNQFRLSPAVWTSKELRRAQNSSQQESTIVMPEISVQKIKMPGRNHHSAPTFDGKPASLSPFLDEIEQLAETCDLSLKQPIEWVIHYAPSDKRELWQMQESVGMEDW
jgi:hypothetical protein